VKRSPLAAWLISTRAAATGFPAWSTTEPVMPALAVRAKTKNETKMADIRRVKCGASRLLGFS